MDMIDEVGEMLLELRIRLQRQLCLQARGDRGEGAVCGRWLEAKHEPLIRSWRVRLRTEQHASLLLRPGEDFVRSVPEPEQQEVGLADDVLDEVDGLQAGALHARHVRVQGLELLLGG